jgi:hypothetical protein
MAPPHSAGSWAPTGWAGRLALCGRRGVSPLMSPSSTDRGGYARTVASPSVFRRDARGRPCTSFGRFRKPLLYPVRADLLPDIHAVRDGAAGRLRVDDLSLDDARGYAEIVEAADTLIAAERGELVDREPRLRRPQPARGAGADRPAATPDGACQ